MRLTLMGVASNLARGYLQNRAVRERESFKTQTHQEMESARGGKRRRSKAVAGADNSLIADFLELRESSMVQTGPKRPRHGGGGELWLTPDPLTPLENIQQGRRKRFLTATKPKSRPKSLTESSKRASSGGRKFTKKAAKSKSMEDTSSTSGNSSTKQLSAAISTLTPLGHLQLDDQGQHKLRTSLATKKSSKKSSIVKSPESTGSDNEPHQTGASSSSLTPSTERQSTSSDNELPQTGASSSSSSSLTPLDSQTHSKIASKKRTSSRERKSSNSKLRAATSTSASDESPGQTAEYAVSGITPLEQLQRKRKRQSKRPSVPGRRKSTMKLKSSGVRGVSWQPHVEQRTSLAAVPFRDSEPVAQGHAHPGHSPPDLSTATETDSEGPQSDLSPPQVEALSSQIEKHYSSSESGEDETPAQTEEPEISPELIEHDASRLAGGLQPSPLTGGHDDISPVTTMGAGASPPPSSSSRHSTGSHTDPEHLKSVLKDAHPRLSSLKRRTRRNSRVSFGRYVTVAEYSPSHRLSNNGRNNSSRNLTMQNFADKDMPLMGRDSTSLPQQGSGERGEGDHASELQGEGSDDVDVESSSSPPPPGELEPLGDEGETGGGGPQVEGDGELEEESADELEAEEPLEEIEQQKRVSRHKKSTVVPRALAKKKQGKRKGQADTLPRTLIKNFFMLFSKRRMTKDAMNLISKFTEVYLKQASGDIAAYTTHAGRKTIEVQDIVLLLKRQRFITEDRPFEYLVNSYLPLEHAEELLPCAKAGKDVIPQMR